MKTEINKEHKKARDNLERFSRAIMVQFSFGRIKTFSDLLRVAGYSEEAIKQKYFPSEYNKTVTRHDVLEYLSDRHIELTTAQYLEVNPPIITYEEPIKTNQKEQEIQEGIVDTTTNALSNSPADTLVDKAIATPDKYVKVHKEEETFHSSSKESEEPTENEDTILEKQFHKSPNESDEIFFFYFQKRAIMKMLKGILNDN